MNLENIIKILDLSSIDDVNKHLDCGWVLLNTYIREDFICSTFTDRTPFCILGWDKSNGDIKYPANPYIQSEPSIISASLTLEDEELGF